MSVIHRPGEMKQVASQKGEHMKRLLWVGRGGSTTSAHNSLWPLPIQGPDAQSESWKFFLGALI